MPSTVVGEFHTIPCARSGRKTRWHIPRPCGTGECVCTPCTYAFSLHHRRPPRNARIRARRPMLAHPCFRRAAFPRANRSNARESASGEAFSERWRNEKRGFGWGMGYGVAAVAGARRNVCSTNLVRYMLRHVAVESAWSCAKRCARQSRMDMYRRAFPRRRGCTEARRLRRRGGFRPGAGRSQGRASASGGGLRRGRSGASAVSPGGAGLRLSGRRGFGEGGGASGGFGRKRTPPLRGRRGFKDGGGFHAVCGGGGLAM